MFKSLFLFLFRKINIACTKTSEFEDIIGNSIKQGNRMMNTSWEHYSNWFRHLDYSFCEGGSDTKMCDYDLITLEG